MNYNKINKKIIDRSDVWFWQADLNISFRQRKKIWSNKHRGISNDVLLPFVNKNINDIKLSHIDHADETSQNNLGFVNSVRSGKLADGQDVIIRCHPKGLDEKYFVVESLFADTIRKLGLPTYKTYAIYEPKNKNEIAFQLIERCEGTAIKNWLVDNPQDMNELMKDAGKLLSKMHTVPVAGFGPFDYKKAKQGQLVGIHGDFITAIRAGLAKNLKVLEKYNTITKEQSKIINKLFDKNNPLLDCKQAVLVYADMTDWNMLTKNGKNISALLDFGDCVASDPIVDIAFWSSRTSFDRIDAFLSGYFGNKTRPKNFNKKLKLFTLRCVLMSMATRVQRARYIKSDFVKGLIKMGNEQLKILFKYFDIL